MKHDKIVIKGAKLHNLKNIDVEIPKGKLTVGLRIFYEKPKIKLNHFPKKNN